MRWALFLPLFDELADPAIAPRLSAETEEARWDGFFVKGPGCYSRPWRRLGHERLERRSVS